jgi:hypothetical protein
MKKLTYFLAAILCLVIVAPLLAVNVSEDATYIIIETLGYKVHWNKPAQMGYMQAFVGGSPDSIIGEAGRAFYHSSDYGGWSDWGELLNWEILEEDPAKVVIKYESRDSRTKEYTCIATYYDTVPYIKHEVTITNTGAATAAFASDHEPQFEVNIDTAGMEVFLEPYPHAVYWTADGYFGALYGPEAVSASAGEWDGRNPGRMQLGHNGIGGTIGNGQSASITYYVAFGEGGRDAALALVDHVQEEPPTSAVSPAGSLTTRWGWIRAR